MDEEKKAAARKLREDKQKERLAQPIRIFTVTLNDPTGNSFVEFHDSMADPQWSMRQYNRTREQNVELGLVAETEQNADSISLSQLHLTAKSKEEAAEEAVAVGANDEIFTFPGICGSCGNDLDTMMKKVVIPYFKVSGCASVDDH